MALEITAKNIKDDQEVTDQARKNVWEWESCTFKLTNPEGETIELNSLHINDFTLGHIREDLEKYVQETHGGVLD